MIDAGNEKTVEIKECVACGGGLLQTDRFCRWCSARQLNNNSEYSALITERIADNPYYRDSEFEQKKGADSYRPVSGPLVKVMAQNVSTGALSQPRNRVTQTLLTTLLSFPLWLMIVFLSPFDAYFAARSMAKRS
jgi:hypothetical protein